METGQKEQPQNQVPSDCLACRLTSGSGMIGAGAYIAFQARSNTNRWARLVMNGVALGFASIGAARVLNVYPFNITHKTLIQEADVNKEPSK